MALFRNFIQVAAPISPSLASFLCNSAHLNLPLYPLPGGGLSFFMCGCIVQNHDLAKLYLLNIRCLLPDFRKEAFCAGGFSGSSPSFLPSHFCVQSGRCYVFFTFAQKP